MITTTTTSAGAIRRLTHRTAMSLAAVEYERMLDLMRSLDPDDWSRDVDDCPAWDVRALTAHLDGNAELAASVRETIRQRRLGKPRAERLGVPLIDGMTEVQVEERADWSPDRLVAACEDSFPRALKARRRTLAPMRALPVDLGEPIGWARLGYLVDTILTRDVWMHRVDLCRATGREMTLTAEHDGRIVADVVREWARRHRRPFRLRLDGHAGGEYREGAVGEEGEEIAIDAVEFCRVLSGRGSGEGLLAQQVPF